VQRAILLIIILAGTFLAGVMLNRPSASWVQTQLLDYLGLTDSEIASVALPAPQAVPVTSPELHARVVDHTPTISQPARNSSSAEGRGRFKKAGHDMSRSVSEYNSGHQDRDTTYVKPNEPKDNISVSKIGGGKQVTPKVDVGKLEKPSVLPSPLDPSVGPAILASFTLPSTTASASTRIPKSAPNPSDVTARRLIQASSDKASAESIPVSKQRIEDWVSLKRKLRSLGVTRYVIEGEVGGRVLFACLVPLAGHQAVAQRFEAEGDDDFTAAQAAVQRLSLWRALHPTTTPAR
jgi:hypothetical protein